MKRLLFLLLVSVFILTGCAKERSHNYTFIYESKISSAYDIEFCLEEYDSAERCVAINRVENPAKGTKHKFKSSPYAECVVVSLSFDGQLIGYVSTVFYLDGYNTEIKIDGTSIIQSELPL